jgi:hypothetical protein
MAVSSIRRYIYRPIDRRNQKNQNPRKKPLLPRLPTPYFPAWRSRLANLGRRLQTLRRQPLLELERIFAPLLPLGLLSQCDQGANSRCRRYTLARTVWAFLWQALNPGCPCREAVRQTWYRSSARSTRCFACTRHAKSISAGARSWDPATLS